MREATKRLVELVGYAGPCSLSFIESDGRLQVHDVNLRLGATVGASVRGGFDLPRLAVNIALGLPLPAEGGPARTITYVRMDGELGALVNELRGRGTGEARGPPGLAPRQGRGRARVDDRPLAVRPVPALHAGRPAAGDRGPGGSRGAPPDAGARAAG